MTDESSTPSPKRKRDPQRNHYNGVRLYPCICRDKDECKQSMKDFIDASDRKRCGYYHLPCASKRRPYGSGNVKSNSMIEVSYRHLFGNSCTPPKSPGNYEYIGFNHFHPSILKDDNGGPLENVDSETAELLNFHRSDIKDGNEDKTTYYPAPTYTKTNYLRDAKSARASLDPIGSYLDDDGDTRELPRPPPIIRKVVAAQRRAAFDPDEAGKENVRLREELERVNQLLNNTSHAANELKAQLKDKAKQLEDCVAREDEIAEMGGLSRENLTSSKWHEDHSKMAKHLWGVGSFKETMCYITKVWFPDVEEKHGKGKEHFTEAEEVLICMMTIHRDYRVATLGSIWHRDGNSWFPRVAQKWMPRLGQVGLYMSILDLDLMLDYIPAHVASCNNVPHSSTSDPPQYTSYITATVPRKFKDKGHERIAAIVDGKIFMTDTVRVCTAIDRLLYSEKTDSSGGLLMTWSAPTSLVFEHTGLYFGRCPENRLIDCGERLTLAKFCLRTSHTSASSGKR